MKTLTIDIKNGERKKEKRFRLRPKPKRSAKAKSMKLKTTSTKNKKTPKKILIIILLIAVSGLGFWGYKTYSSLIRSGINLNPTTTIFNTIAQKDPELAKDENDLTSVLIVGIDTRPSDPGLQNTDSIIVMTINHKTKAVTMISLPRDLWVENPNYPGYFTKINAIYNLCEANVEGEGMQCLVDVAETVTNLNIQYHGMIDIGGAVEIIDILGGVDVDVENSFTDYMFPTPQHSYETISFEQGMQHMDGETAMKFARSRHALSFEGSDFARARRQQRIIIAAKEKLLSMETLMNPVKILNIMDELSDSIKVSDITTEDIRAGLLLAQKIEKGSIYTMVLDPMSGNWTLITEDPSDAYVLFPKAGAGNWENIHEFVSSYISVPALYSENSRVYVYNGGLGYNETYLEFNSLAEKYPYLNLTFGGNTYPLTYEGTTIISFSEADKFATLNELKDYFDADWTNDPPEGSANPYAEDIVIILGTPIIEPEDPAPADQNESAN